MLCLSSELRRLRASPYRGAVSAIAIGLCIGPVTGINAQTASAPPQNGQTVLPPVVVSAPKPKAKKHVAAKRVNASAA